MERGVSWYGDSETNTIRKTDLTGRRRDCSRVDG